MADLEREPFIYRFSEWTPMAEMLAAIHEQLQVLVNVTVKANNGKPVKITRWPRPVAATQKILQRRKLETHERIVRQLLPDK